MLHRFSVPPSLGSDPDQPEASAATGTGSELHVDAASAPTPTSASATGSSESRLPLAVTPSRSASLFVVYELMSDGDLGRHLPYPSPAVPGLPGLTDLERVTVSH